MSIVNQYGMVFQNKLVKRGTTNKKLYKSVSTHNIYLTDFLNDWQSVEEIDELLLPDLDEALENVNAIIDNGSETVIIVIHHDWVKFYYDETKGKVYEVPTNDFKEIIKNWKEFLLNPPLK